MFVQNDNEETMYQLGIVACALLGARSSLVVHPL